MTLSNALRQVLLLASLCIVVKGCNLTAASLKFENRSSRLVKGCYYQNESLSLCFEIRPGFIQLTDKKNNILVRYRKLARQRFHVQVLGDNFLWPDPNAEPLFIGTARKQTNTWVDQLDEQTLEISGGAGDRQTTKTASTSDDSGQSFPALYQTSMEKLRGKQEMQLLEHVSHALHDEARHYPITRAFHVMSMSLLAAEHGKNTHARDTETAGLNNHRYTSIFDKKRGTCEDLRGDPRRNKCMECAVQSAGAGP
ncbi:hypothetical protein OS493_010768 [Desmophyllum pertusum]|uniref:Secreted protein n=1 Tax=Desmophyllum pertusum TaxID=174260 RepID=A0A9W9ZEH5_9CNID|nr:hypothetical protein OS493_010768 [Desmophyllum pertusum]